MWIVAYDECVVALVGAAIGSTLANFVYQYFTFQLWSVALERSWFEVVALFIAWLLLRANAQKVK